MPQKCLTLLGMWVSLRNLSSLELVGFQEWIIIRDPEVKQTSPRSVVRGLVRGLK